MKKTKLLSLILLGLLCSVGNVWGAASTSTDGKYASGTIDFSTIGTLSANTTYWHNGVKFYSGNSASVSASTSAWSESVSIPAYISSKKFGNKSTASNKWGSNGAGAQYTSSGFACSQHTIGIHVNSACTLTVIVNKNLGSDTDDAGITASIDATAYGTAWTSSTYKAAGTTELTVTSARADKTKYPGRYTLTIIVTAGNLTDGEAVVKMFNSSSGTGAGKLFCWESITITTPSCSTPDAPTGFEVNSVSSTSATFEITDSEGASSYDIYCSTSSTEPTAETDATINVNTKTPTIDALTASTTYYAWVRSVCDASHKSDWVALSTPGYFTTPTPKCEAPTIVVGDFNFENHGYKVTITNNETSSTLKVSTDGSLYTTQTSPYVTYATSTTHYYAKAVDKTGYDDSDVTDENVTNTYAPAKSYVAWVYESNYENAPKDYNVANDEIYKSLKTIYNVVLVDIKDYKSSITDEQKTALNGNLDDADLVFISEAAAGGGKGMIALEDLVGNVPVLNMKIWVYTYNSDASKNRWGWGTLKNEATTKRAITPISKMYKLWNGVEFAGDSIILFSGSNSRSHIQTIDESKSLPSGNVNMAYAYGTTNVTMHASNSLKYFALGLSCDDYGNYNTNAITIVKNAAAMLIAGEDLDVSSVSGTISAAGWCTFSSSYPLNLASLPAGLNAYIIEESKVDLANSTITLTAINTAVPAGTGLLLKGAEGLFTIPVAASAETVSGNKLVGCPSVQVLSENANYYVLVNNDGAQFQSLEDQGATVGVGKAYLDLTGLSLAPGALRIVVEEDNATAIESIEANEEIVKFFENGNIYIMRNGIVYDAVGRVVR